MKLSIRMIVAAITLWLALAEAARTDSRDMRALRGDTRSAERAKQPRATRGFKNTEMMIARGFGKRGLALHAQEPLNALSMGPTDNFLDMLETPQDHSFLDQLDEKLPESVPIDWFVDELLNNPELTRTVVRKFMDTNQDGMLSPDELLRNLY